jgi:hypothetical protein
MFANIFLLFQILGASVSDLLGSSGMIEVGFCKTGIPHLLTVMLRQELSLQRIDCSAECLLQAISQLAAKESCSSHLAKLRCDQHFVFTLNIFHPLSFDVLAWLFNDVEDAIISLKF